MKLTPSAHLALLPLLALAPAFAPPPLIASASDSPLCTVRNPATNEEYNLNLLSVASSWVVTVPESANKEFKLNVCHAVDTGGAVTGADVGAFYKEKGESKGVNIGQKSMVPKLFGDRLVLQYSDGDFCPKCNDLRRETVISFICDKSAGQGTPKLVGSTNDCGYFIEWRSSVACPTSSSGSGLGHTLFSIFSVGAMIYLFGGILWNRLKYNAHGLEQIPHWSFWRGIFDFCKDIFLIIFAKCIPERRPSVYRGLPRDEENGLIDDNFEEH